MNNVIGFVQFRVNAMNNVIGYVQFRVNGFAEYCNLHCQS